MNFEWRQDPSDPLFEIEYDGENWTGARRRVDVAAAASTEVVTRKTFPLWAKVLVPAGALLVIGVGVAAVVTSLVPSGSSVAQQECSSRVISQMKSPASAALIEAKTAGPFEGSGVTDVDTPEMNYIREDVMSHVADLDEVSSMGDAASQFADSGGWPAGTYWVGGAVDGENSFGATVRNHFVCFVAVVDGEVTKAPSISWFTG